METYIKVNYTYATTMYGIQKALKDLPYMLALDFETQSLYSKDNILEAKELIKEGGLDRPTERLCKVVANSSGLSYPSITKITHVNLAWSEKDALILVINDLQTEKYILEWIIKAKHHFLIHNSLFDLKQVYVKTKHLPNKYDDTQLLLKSLINHSETWKANTGLKHIMKDYYDPKWVLVDDYNNTNLKDETFLMYCAIDACSTYKLWKLLNE